MTDQRLSDAEQIQKLQRQVKDLQKQLRDILMNIENLKRKEKSLKTNVEGIRKLKTKKFMEERCENWHESVGKQCPIKPPPPPQEWLKKANMKLNHNIKGIIRL